MITNKLKYERIYLYLILAYILLPLVLLMAIHHIFLLDTISKMELGYFGTYYSYISVKNDDMVSADFIKEIQQSSAMKDISFALIQDEKENSIKIRSIFYTKNYVKFPMVKGRFLLPQDFVKDNYVCVVGKDYQNQIYYQNQKEWINLNGQAYEVLGIMGYEEESILNGYIYINGLAGYKFSTSIYLFDCTSLNPTKNEINEFIEEENKKGIIIEEISGGYRYGESIVTHVQSAKWFVLLLGCILISTLLMTVQWVSEQKRKIIIKKLLGAEDIDIYTEISIKLLVIAFLSFVITYLVCLRFYPYYLSGLWKIYVLHSVVSLLISRYITKYLCKQSIVEEINR